MTELLLETALDRNQRELAATVHRSGEHLLSVVNDILDFSKIEAGKVELEYMSFDLHELAEDAVHLLAERAHAKGLELACNIGMEVPRFAKGDPMRLKQMLVNLINNAIKFTESGEVVLGLRATHEEGEQLWCEFSVRDTGIGIERAAQELVFEAFSQADGTMTRRFGGTGLGLAIVRRLATLMGGSITLESEPGKGSTFTLRAKLRKEESNAAHPCMSSPVDLAGMQVLVIDDNETNRDILFRQLSALGLCVDTVESAAQALRRLEEPGNQYRLTLVDIHMPEMSGTDLIRAVRKRGLGGDALHIIVLSSVGSDLDLAETERLRIDSWLRKPVRTTELRQRVTQLLSAAIESSPQTRSPTVGAAEKFDARVLLVEDNPVNQMVAQRVLESFGCSVDTVSDGLAAVEAVSATAYDLILMDCQMPQMDGFEATARVRAWEQRQGLARTPIVALTANAMQSDRQRCLSAGMDDYISKPFKRAEMGRTLRTWIGSRARSLHDSLSASDLTTSDLPATPAPRD